MEKNALLQYSDASLLISLLSHTVILQADLVRRVEETKDVPLPVKPAITPVWVRDETIAGLSCRVAGNSEKPKMVGIIVHGYGANNHDFVDYGRYLLKGLSSDEIPAQFIFPNGFLQLQGGAPTQRAWWPIDFQLLIGEVLQGRLHLHVPPGMAEARKRIMALIDEIKARYSLATKNIVLGGFSQGAMLTTDVTLHLSESPAALLILSGTYVAEPVWKPLAPNRKGLRVIQQHGTNDQVRHASP